MNQWRNLASLGISNTKQALCFKLIVWPRLELDRAPTFEPFSNNQENIYFPYILTHVLLKFVDIVFIDSHTMAILFKKLIILYLKNEQKLC